MLVLVLTCMLMHHVRMCTYVDINTCIHACQCYMPHLSGAGGRLGYFECTFTQRIVCDFMYVCIMSTYVLMCQEPTSLYGQTLLQTLPASLNDMNLVLSFILSVRVGWTQWLYLCFVAASESPVSQRGYPGDVSCFCCVCTNCCCPALSYWCCLRWCQHFRSIFSLDTNYVCRCVRVC